MDEACLTDWRDRAIRAEVQVMSLRGELEHVLGQLWFLEDLARAREMDGMTDESAPQIPPAQPAES